MSNDSPIIAQTLTAGHILVAFEKLFSGGRGVSRSNHSGLRYLNLTGGAILIEQNPKKRSKWAQLANTGHRVAWVMCNQKYVARVVDGEVLMLGDVEGPTAFVGR